MTDPRDQDPFAVLYDPRDQPEYQLFEQPPDELRRLKRALARAIRQELTPLQRETLRLYYGEGLKMREIAALRGCTVSAVSRCRKRAILRLRALMGLFFEFRGESPGAALRLEEGRR